MEREGQRKEDFAYIKHGITCPSVFPHPDGDNHQVLMLPLQLHLPAALLQANHGCPDLLKLHKVFAPSLSLESLHHEAILIASLDGYKPTHPQKGNKIMDALIDTLIPLFKFQDCPEMARDDHARNDTPARARVLPVLPKITYAWEEPKYAFDCYFGSVMAGSNATLSCPC
jgi:hypothetical protein